MASLTGLYLELPYGYVDSYAKRAAGPFEMLDRYFGESSSFTLADLPVDAVGEPVLALIGLNLQDNLPWNSHCIA